MTQPQVKPPVLGQRLVITEGMSVEQVKKEGNAAQKAAICIFDKDANGLFDKEEASLFNNTRIAVYGDQAKIYKSKYKKGENPLLDTVDLKKTNAKYEAKLDSKKRFEDMKAEEEAIKEKLAPVLTPYGLNADNAEWVGIDNAEVKTINGKKTLVLTSKRENYQLELTIDKNYAPEKIYMWRAEDEANVHFEGVNGTLRLNGENPGFAFKDSNVTVIGKDGNADYLAFYEGTTMKVKTNEYCDVVDDRRTHEGTQYTENHPDIIHLRPGTTEIK